MHGSKRLFCDLFVYIVCLLAYHSYLTMRCLASCDIYITYNNIHEAIHDSNGCNAIPERQTEFHEQFNNFLLNIFLTIRLLWLCAC